ncbi:hypothetical protein DASC09_047710 [Saccharomycopsis crataegensis]|uniref:Sorbose reductase SOU1 n=1 Tax=Saccharomycopsis crataegensis TaxID=43959 RepID=A0AAV5QSE1_9ASCO|nr:hypothetical protein DASC09_047710 [Saccharomycopsis crataegensis]
MARTVARNLGPLPRPTPAPKSKNVLDLFSLKGKFASVTGSSSGIGFAVAEAFAQAGADVAIWYNSNPTALKKADDLAQKYSIKAKAYKCNISDEAEVEKTIKQQLEDFGGKIDIFVANAGATSPGDDVIDQESSEGWKKLLDINLNGVYYAAKVVGRYFKKQGFGSFVITASISGHIINVPQSQTVYNVSKAAVKHLAKSLAIEWSGFARVNTVSPGYISTDITNFADNSLKEKWWTLTPMGREGATHELVGAYLYLASDASTYTTGTDILVDGGYTCI